MPWAEIVSVIYMCGVQASSTRLHSETDAETKSWVPSVCLRRDPRKHRKEKRYFRQGRGRSSLAKLIALCDICLMPRASDGRCLWNISFLGKSALLLFLYQHGNTHGKAGHHSEDAEVTQVKPTRLQPNLPGRLCPWVARLFMETRRHSLDWIWGLLYRREFTPGIVNRLKTHD